MAGQRKVRMFVVLGPGEPRPELAELAFLELALLGALLEGVSRAPGTGTKVAEPGLWVCGFEPAKGCPFGGICPHSRRG